MSRPDSPARRAPRGYRSGDATRFIQHQIDRHQFRGRTTREALRAAFHVPAQGVLVVDPVMLRRIIRAHRKLPELTYLVPRTEEYLLPVADLRAAMNAIDPVALAAWDPPGAPLPDRPITLLAEPEIGELDAYAIEHFALRFWALLVHAAVHARCLELDQAGVMDDARLRRSVARIGLVEFEEVREVFATERMVFDTHDDLEVLFELLAYWVSLDAFSPELIESFFPSLAPRAEDIDALLVELGIDRTAILVATRPAHAPSPDELAHRRTERIRGAGEPLEIHQLAFHLRNVMDGLARAEPLAGVSPEGLKSTLEPEVRALIGRFIVRDRIVRALTYDDLRRQLLAGGGRPAREILALDSVLARELGRLYRPARKAERRALERAGDATVDPGRGAEPGREACARATAAMREAYDAPPRVRGAVVRAVGWLMDVVLFAMYRAWLDPVARRLAGSSAFALRLHARRCVRGFRRTLAASRRADHLGNRARAALALRHAAGWAAAVGDRAPSDATLDLDRLLAEALARRTRELAAWIASAHGLVDHEHVERLVELVEFAIERAESAPRGLEVRLLYDLQGSAQKLEREDRKLDVRGFLFALGRAPLVRDLPLQGRLAAVRSLRAAQARLGQIKIKRSDVKAFGEVLDAGEAHHAGKLRATLEEEVARARDEVGLAPRGMRETTSAAKLGGELADLALAHGQFTFPQVRDAISRNDLKLPDLSLREAVFGDQLLRLDRKLAAALFGIYSPAPIYLRFLQWFNAPLYGTLAGRLFTTYVLLPFAAAFIVLEGLAHTVGLLYAYLAGIDPHDLHWAAPATVGGFGAALVFAINFQSGRRCARFLGWIVGSFFRAIGRGLAALFASHFLSIAMLWIVVPGAIGLGAASLVKVAYVELSESQALLDHAAQEVGYGDASYHFELLDEQYFINGSFGVVYLMSVLILNTPLGRRTRAWAGQLVADSATRLTKTLWVGLVVGTIDAFAKLVHGIEYVRYTVENSLRFERRDGLVSFFAKSVLGVVWFWISYLLVLYVTILVEPQVNPIKHFPVVTVSHKIIIPILPRLTMEMSALVPDFVPKWISYPFIGLTVFLVPGLFGFLVWELKENWKLYRANRAREVQPVIVGSHGETLPRLLRKGFHSGTIPKLLGKIRRAGRVANRTGDWSKVVHLRHRLHHVEESLALFVERSLLEPMRRDAMLMRGGVELHGGHPRMTNNKVELAVVFARESECCALSLYFEDVFGWIIGSCSHDQAAYEAFFAPEERVRLDTYLGVLYKQAGVELVREHVEQALADGLARWRAAMGGIGAAPVKSYKIDDRAVYLDVFDDVGVSLQARIECSLVLDPVKVKLVRYGPDAGVVVLEEIALDKLVFAKCPLPWDEVDAELSGSLPASGRIAISRIDQRQFSGIF